MTAEQLKRHTLKDLSAIARKRGVEGWHDMRKEQLVRALLRARGQHATAAKLATRAVAGKSHPAAKPRDLAKRGTTKKGSSRADRSSARATAVRPVTATKRAIGRKPATTTVLRGAKKSVSRQRRSPGVERRIRAAIATQDRRKNLAFRSPPGKPGGFQRDRMVVMVRDPFWLHAYWELSRRSVERAQVAMGQDWHLARPVLRLLDVSSSGTTSTSERVVRDIEIHGGVNNWYVDIREPRSYRLEIGYLAKNGRFFSICRSNVVTSPKAGSSDVVDENWTEVAENFDRIYALSGGYCEEGNSHELQELFEERLRRPMGSPFTTRYGSGLDGLIDGRKRDFHFDVDAELLVFGSTRPDAHVTLQGEPVPLRPDGTFTMRFSMPNARQVIPAVASSSDGVEQRTVVLAVERNTKVMEPMVRDANE